MNFIATMPCLKFMDIEAVISLYKMLTGIYERNDHFQMAFSYGFNAAKSRNDLFKHVVRQEEDFDYVVCMDSDHIYGEKILYSLVDKIEKNNLDMLSASYYTSSGESLAMLVERDGKIVKPQRDDKLEGIQKAHTVGFGFVVFKMDMIKRLSDLNDGYLFHMDTKDHGTEDTYFCGLARKAGYDIYFDADTVVGHLKKSIIK